MAVVDMMSSGGSSFASTVYSLTAAVTIIAIVTVIVTATQTVAILVTAQQSHS